MSETPQSKDDSIASKPDPSAERAALELQKDQAELRSFRGVLVDVSIELGRGKLRLRDLLGLRYHSIFELDKAAGANLDLYVNGILLARGEPVIQEDRVRIKINEIVELER